MKLGNQTDTYGKYCGIEEAIRGLAKIGFDALDFSMFYGRDRNKETPLSCDIEKSDEYFKNAKNIADECGVYFEQVHTPFPVYTDDEDEYKFRMENQKRAIRAAGILGAKYAIIHPGALRKRLFNECIEETKEINIKMYTELIPYLQEYNVKCAVENMFAYDSERHCSIPSTCSTAEEMVDYIDTLGRDNFVACLDIGHSNIIHEEGFETINTYDMIKILGDRLCCLHVHDNDGKEDQHVAPLMGNIDWPSVFKGLKEIDYKGVFTYEADAYIRLFGPSNIVESEKLLHSIGRNLIKENW